MREIDVIKIFASRGRRKKGKKLKILNNFTPKKRKCRLKKCDYTQNSENLMKNN